jgi:hypothetical protein
MQSKLVPRRLPRPAGGSDLAQGAGVWIYLCIYCALVSCFGFGFYSLMQPARFANPGAALAGRIGDLPQLQVSTAADKPGLETVSQEPPLQSEVKKSETAAGRSGSKRPRYAAARQRHDPSTDYAAQPYAGRDRAWDWNQSWSGQRRWDWNQSWGRQPRWNKNQSSGGQRPWDSNRSSH